MGGGRSKFLPNTTIDHQKRKGQRLDGRNLINEWMNINRNLGSQSAYVGNRSQLKSLKTNETDYLLGEYLFLFKYKTFYPVQLQIPTIL